MTTEEELGNLVFFAARRKGHSIGRLRNDTTLWYFIDKMKIPDLPFFTFGNARRSRLTKSRTDRLNQHEVSFVIKHIRNFYFLLLLSDSPLQFPMPSP